MHRRILLPLVLCSLALLLIGLFGIGHGEWPSWVEFASAIIILGIGGRIRAAAMHLAHPLRDDEEERGAGSSTHTKV